MLVSKRLAVNAKARWVRELIKMSLARSRHQSLFTGSSEPSKTGRHRCGRTIYYIIHRQCPYCECALCGRLLNWCLHWVGHIAMQIITASPATPGTFATLPYHSNVPANGSLILTVKSKLSAFLLFLCIWKFQLQFPTLWSIRWRALSTSGKHSRINVESITVPQIAFVEAFKLIIHHLLPNWAWMRLSQQMVH